MFVRYLAVTAMVAVLFLGGCSSLPKPSNATTAPPPIPPAVDKPTLRVERLATNPIITPQMLAGHDGENIGDPSLIRVPDWVSNPLGKYYLYFAHHHGQYIRMAYANHIEGPWKIFEPGALKLEGTICDSASNSKWAKKKHLASPDVIVDEKAREIRMYFHCPPYIAGTEEETGNIKEFSYVARSKNGLDFKAQTEALGNWFFRVFHWAGSYYALAMPGVFYRSADGLSGFEKGPTLFSKNMRHSAVKVQGDTLQVFYSLVGDNPERILLSTIALSAQWQNWRETPARVILEPEREWEGATLPLKPSERGPAREPVRQLRDPAIFVDQGRTFLLYSVAGEQGIGIAEIHTDNEKNKGGASAASQSLPAPDRQRQPPG